MGSLWGEGVGSVNEKNSPDFRSPEVGIYESKSINLN